MERGSKDEEKSKRKRRRRSEEKLYDQGDTDRGKKSRYLGLKC